MAAQNSGVRALGATDKVMSILTKADEFFLKNSENLQDVHAKDEEHHIDTTFSQFVPVRVISGDGVAGYICDIFENGLAEPATKRGRVFLANGNSTIYTLPVGTVMFAQAINISKIGTNNGN